MKKNRIIWLDALKGAILIMVIFVHTFNWGHTVRNAAESFFMPLFFIVSGYTFKAVEKRDLVTSEVRDLKRILMPAAIVLMIGFVGRLVLHQWSVTDGLLSTFKTMLWGNSYDCSFAKGCGALWFLYALFWGKFAYRTIHIIAKNRIWLRYILIIIPAVIFAFLNFRFTLYLPQYVDGAFLVAFFMELGYDLRLYDDKKQYKAAENFAAFISIILWCALFFGADAYMLMNSRNYNLISLLTALCGSIFTIWIFRAFKAAKMMKYLSVPGKYTLELLCVHSLDFLFFPQDKYGVLWALLRIVIDLILTLIYAIIYKLIIKTISDRKKQ